MWQALFGKRSRSLYTPLEARLLEELQRSLSEEARQLLSAQVARITSVRRFDGSREVCYYYEVHGKIYHDPGGSRPRSVLRVAP